MTPIGAAGNPCRVVREVGASLGGTRRIHRWIVPVGAALAAAKPLKQASLKGYPGAPHGLTATHKEELSADLLAFLKVQGRCVGAANILGRGPPHHAAPAAER
jgi:hypothetical protein